MAFDTPHASWRAEHGVLDAHTHFDIDRLDDCRRYMTQNHLEGMIDIGRNMGAELDRKLAATAEYPDTFGVFTGVDFDGFGTAGWVDREVARVTDAIDAGALGVKFWKDLGTTHTDPDGTVIPVDDERLAPIIEAVGDRDGVVAFHTADPKGFFEPLTTDNDWYETLQDNPDWYFGDREEHPYRWWQLIRQLERVVARHPETTILGVHFGGAAEEAGYVAEVLREYPNYFVDVAARIGLLGRHRPDRIQDIVLEFQDRILFGTDIPVWEGSDRSDAEIEAIYDGHWRFFETEDEAFDPPTGRPWTIDAIDLPRPVLAKLYRDNAHRVFGLAEPDTP